MSFLKKKKKTSKILGEYQERYFLVQNTSQPREHIPTTIPNVFTPTITSEEYKSTKLFGTIISLTIFLSCIIRGRVETITTD